MDGPRCGCWHLGVARRKCSTDGNRRVLGDELSKARKVEELRNGRPTRKPMDGKTDAHCEGWEFKPRGARGTRGRKEGWVRQERFAGATQFSEGLPLLTWILGRLCGPERPFTPQLIETRIQCPPFLSTVLPRGPVSERWRSSSCVRSSSSSLDEQGVLPAEKSGEVTVEVIGDWCASALPDSHQSPITQLPHSMRVAISCAWRHSSAARKACSWVIAFSVRFRQSRMSWPKKGKPTSP